MEQGCSGWLSGAPKGFGHKDELVLVTGQYSCRWDTLGDGAGSRENLSQLRRSSRRGTEGSENTAPIRVVVLRRK